MTGEVTVIAVAGPGSGAAETIRVAHVHVTFHSARLVSTHGRSGLDRVLLGSTAETIVREAPCSVLIVRGSRARSVASG